MTPKRKAQISRQARKAAFNLCGYYVYIRELWDEKKCPGCALERAIDKKNYRGMLRIMAHYPNAIQATKRLANEDR